MQWKYAMTEYLHMHIYNGGGIKHLSRKNPIPST